MSETDRTSEPTAPAQSAEVAGNEESQVPTSQPVLLKAVRWGLISTLVLVLAFAGIGWLASGTEGVIGGALGAAIGGFFLLMTAGSIAFANRFIDSPIYVGVFFGIVLGAWLLKFILFIVILVLLRDQTWLDSRILFFGLVASVLASLALDAIIATKARIPIANAGV